MFCYQCQETARNEGCTVVGVCGKTPLVANRQDLLIWQSKALAELVLKAELSTEDKLFYGRFIVKNLFMTITNANFDDDVIIDRVIETIEAKKTLLEVLDKETLSEKALYIVTDREELDRISSQVGVLLTENVDIRSLREIIAYGLKGLAAYVHHALVLGKEDEEIYRFIEEALNNISRDDFGKEDLIGLVIKTGEYGVRGMNLLDSANTSSYGNPEVTSVNIGAGSRPGILISGHDLKDMEMLLEQTKGTGVDVYTHSEMLPANYYPKFKKYDNLHGNYGNAWWKQKDEFESFNGPILMTTNCIVPPKASYIDRMFTTGAAGYPGCRHIEADEKGNKDFSEIIELAKTCKAPEQIESGEIIGGFAHNQVFALADKVVDAVKTGAIKKFIVMAGCDGRQSKRNYYADFAKALPQDTVILTAGCAKYRYNKLGLGDIGGIPRVLDAGQCNDSYSLVLIALKLKEIFGLESINDLPLVYNIAWYEQKAVIVLLALLYLGVKNIHLGPTLPAFISPNVADFLVENFGIASIGNVEEDIDSFFPEVKEEKETKVRALAAEVGLHSTIGEIVSKYPQTVSVFQAMGMHCLGCPASQMENIEQASMVHGMDPNKILDEIKRVIGE